MGYHRLTPEDRYQIEALRQSGISLRRIAKQLHRNPSTISREIRACPEIYQAKKAQIKSQEKVLAKAHARRKIDGEMKAYVREKLQIDWSPEQIAGRAKLDKQFQLSQPTIYRFLQREKASGCLLWKHLRILRKQRKNRQSPAWKPPAERLGERNWIKDRPAVVQDRARIGDYERDTVFGKFNGPLFLTIVDRASRVIRIRWLPKKSSILIHEATVEALSGEVLHTITNDNGCEFAKHEITARVLGKPIYFSNCYRAWERGTNENLNGLLRQYFPKGRDLSGVTAEQVQEVENQLNNRPRKCLGYKTPLEVHEILRSQSVALET